MVAKLIVHGDTRAQALARLGAALAATHIVGLHTNVAFLRRVVASQSFATADLDTALIPREQAVLFHQQPLPAALAAAASVAMTLESERAQEGPDPFSRRDGWKSHGESLRRLHSVFDGEPLPAELRYGHDGRLHLAVGAGDARVEGDLSWQVQPAGPGLALDLTFGGWRERVHVYRRGEEDHVFAGRGAAVLAAHDPLAHAGEGESEGGRLTAPMPGKVVSFAVQAGDAVRKGQPLAVMEAMKMEHTVSAPAAGSVAELLFAPGEQVAEGAPLLRLDMQAD
jgi:3-methylcrotonyl-CoA carboxylase alpha subunit